MSDNERFIDCWNCYGEGRVLKAIPVNSFGVWGQGPFELVPVRCWVCDGVGHLGVTIKEYCEKENTVGNN